MFRFQLTAGYVEELIAVGYKDPHHVLNEYIERLCGVTPSDGEEWGVEDIDMEVDETDIAMMTDESTIIAELDTNSSLVGLPAQTNERSKCPR